MSSEPPTPKIVFIVPYRDREQQQQFFDDHMKNRVMADYSPEEFKILYVHQCDTRGFNRGALKNIGYIYVRQTWPTTYRTITLVFNDVDTMPYTAGFLDYETSTGVIKHFYGYKYALGGIIAMTAKDFEDMNGFPNFWAWGYEDNLLNYRAITHKKTVDRSRFFPIMDKNIMHFNDGLQRHVNRKEFDRYVQETPEGISSIRDLAYEVAPIDDISAFVNVSAFKTDQEEDVSETRTFNVVDGPRPFGNVGVPIRSRRGRVGMKMVMR